MSRVWNGKVGLNWRSAHIIGFVVVSNDGHNFTPIQCNDVRKERDFHHIGAEADDSRQ